MAVILVARRIRKLINGSVQRTPMETPEKLPCRSKELHFRAAKWSPSNAIPPALYSGASLAKRACVPKTTRETVHIAWPSTKAELLRRTPLSRTREESCGRADFSYGLNAREQARVSWQIIVVGSREQLAKKMFIRC